jgi:pimeloyl-ACP methyl ester carboxylesterase
LVNALGGEPVVIVGHDWGAWVTQFAALFRTDLFRAVALLSVPFLPRLSISPSAWEQQKYPGKIFYQQISAHPDRKRSLKPTCMARSSTRSTLRLVNRLPVRAGSSLWIRRRRAAER